MISIRIPSPMLVVTSLMFACVGVAHAADSARVQCELARPILFGGMNWESNLVITEIESFVMENGYGCKTEVVPIETLPALAALQRGDLDVNAEIWLNSVSDPWHRAHATGKVKRVGDVYTGGQGWFVPRYTAERLPGLKSALDLPQFKDNFADPEEPGKGRFYGCPAGWACEVTNARLFHALKLDDTFSLYSPGTGAAQKATIMSAYQRKQNIVFYYWYPTPLVGALDLVKLEMPPVAAGQPAQAGGSTSANLGTGHELTHVVFTAVNTQFAAQAPQLTQFLSKVALPLPVINEILSHMQESGDDSAQVAHWFLKNKSEIWSQWVPAEVANRVKAAL